MSSRRVRNTRAMQTVEKLTGNNGMRMDLGYSIWIGEIMRNMWDQKVAGIGSKNRGLIFQN